MKPAHITDIAAVLEYEDLQLKCGRLEQGFLRVRCEVCHDEKLVAFSCRRRGFCPSCGARRMAESAALLVDAVLPREPMRQWVLSVPFALRFLFASAPPVMGQVLGIVYRAIAAHLIRKAGLTHATAQTGAVTLIQRFGSALNLNIHFHLLFLDGVYVTGGDALGFRPLGAPTTAELNALLERISGRVGRYLERQGLLVRDLENSHLTLESPHDPAMDEVLGHSITYRVAVGPLSKAARPSRYRQRRPRHRDATTARWRKRPASRCTPRSRPQPMSGASWKVCAGTLHAPQYRARGCH